MLAAVAEQRRAGIEIDVRAVAEHLQPLVDLQALGRPAIHPAGRRLAGQQSSQRRCACIAITARFSCAVNGRGEIVSPGRDHRRFRGASRGRGSGPSPASSGRDHVLRRQLLEHAVLHPRRGRRGASCPPAGAAAGSGSGRSRTPRRIGPRAAREYCAARSETVRSPGRSETAAAAAASPASPKRCTAASRPRDRRRSGRLASPSSGVFWPTTRPPSITMIGTLAAAWAAAAALVASSFAAAIILSLAADLAAFTSGSTGGRGAARVVCPPPIKRAASARAVARTAGA